MVMSLVMVGGCSILSSIDEVEQTDIASESACLLEHENNVTKDVTVEAGGGSEGVSRWLSCGEMRGCSETRLWTEGCGNQYVGQLATR